MICWQGFAEKAMRIYYPQTIRQDPKRLQEYERQIRGTSLAARARLLRLLKTGQARSLPEAARLLGYSTVQVTRWWACYRQHGLAGLLKKHPRPGRPSPMTTAAWRGLQQEMRAGRITRLEDARRYLQHRWKIHYGSVNGVWHMLRQRRVKWKTGRRRHRQADAAAQTAFKKTLGAY
jgi:putative transposase